MIGSVGRLRVTRDKLWVDVDPGIVQVCRALIPPPSRPQPQRYPPHITVVRNEAFVLPPGFAEHDIDFAYDPIVVNDDTYWWLRAVSPQLTALRLSLGLPASSEFSRPPDGDDCFHVTVGNTKVRL